MGPDGRSDLVKVVMPPEKEIMGHFTATDFLGKEPAVDVFFSTLAFRLSGRNINATELNRAWTYIAADTLIQASPLARLVIGSHFDNIMEAIVPDRTVIDEVSYIRREYLDELKKLGTTETAEWEHLRS